MTPLKLGKYAGDDKRLLDVGDAEFLRRKVRSDTQLDFTDVAEVGAAFLDVLLEGETPESVGDRATGMCLAVDGALAQWVDRRSRPVTKIEKPRSRPKVRFPRPTVAPVALERAPTTDDRYTPTRLIRRLGDALRGYIESAYPLADPILVCARRVLLETEEAGHLLAQEPFIETTTRYTMSDRAYTELGLPAHVAAMLDGLSRARVQQSAASDDRTVLFPKFYGHQEHAFREFLTNGRDIVVATGTGSGKTECFLVPMLGALYEEAHSRPKSFGMPSVRALILYPMNALVNDQLARLRLLFGDPAVADAFRKTAGVGFRDSGCTPVVRPMQDRGARRRTAIVWHLSSNTTWGWSQSSSSGCDTLAATQPRTCASSTRSRRSGERPTSPATVSGSSTPSTIGTVVSTQVSKIASC